MGSPAILFFKYQALGNDFIILYQTELTVERQVALCDRHLGVGADGVIVVYDSDRPGILARMTVTNADGSIAEMCGNGFRCVAKWFADEKNILSGTIRTDAGDKTFHFDGENCVVDMGFAELGKSYSEPAKGMAVSMGNPHLVLNLGADETLARELGSKLEHHPDFPQRTNVEFVKIINSTEIEIRVWERGAGLTQACGSGACAAVAAFVSQGLVLPEQEITVSLPGGILWVTAHLEEKRWRMIMKGPAQRVFVGEVA